VNGGILEISTQGLLYGFLPAFIVLAIMWRWQAAAAVGTAVYAMGRMLVQLFLIGYVLIYIFDSDNFWIIVGVSRAVVWPCPAFSWGTSDRHIDPHRRSRQLPCDGR